MGSYWEQRRGKFPPQFPTLTPPWSRGTTKAQPCAWISLWLGIMVSSALLGKARPGCLQRCGCTGTHSDTLRKQNCWNARHPCSIWTNVVFQDPIVWTSFSVKTESPAPLLLTVHEEGTAQSGWGFQNRSKWRCFYRMLKDISMINSVLIFKYLL